MKLTTKKIIAREFLTLTLVLTIGLISFLCTYPYNAFKRKQVENKSAIISEKTKLTDSLSISYKTKLDKQNWFFEKFSNHYDLSDDTTFDERYEIWKKFDNWALKDSINYRWEHEWGGENTSFLKSIGFPNPKSLQSFIEKNRITKMDSSNFNSSLAINSEIALLSKSKNDNDSKILSYSEQIEFGLKALIICFIILFGFRYLFYSLKWSIKTLKQKPE
jgi:hypothetical protein